MSRFVNLKTFAAERGISYEHARRAAASGEIPTTRVGRAIRVDLDALEAQEARRRGTPPPGDWLAEQLAAFTPDDLRRAAEVLVTVARSAELASTAGGN